MTARKVMLLALALLAVPVSACALMASPSRVNYYITKPAQTFEDSTAESAIVLIEDNTLLRMNAVMTVAYRDDHEEGACLRIAARKGSAFWIDSIVSATYTTPPTKWAITFVCPTDMAQVHWHVVDDPRQCEVSPADTGPWKSRYALSLMMCGYGIDSIVAYRVRKRSQAASGR